MLLLCPLPYVPVLIAAAGVLGLVPDFIEGEAGRRTAGSSRSPTRWSYLAPVLILAAFAPGPARALVGSDLRPRARRAARHRLRADGDPQLAAGRRADHGARPRLRGRQLASSSSFPLLRSSRRSRPYEEPLVLVAVIASAGLAARQLLEGPCGEIRRSARAQPRLSRHGDAALGRARVRGRVHRAALALGGGPRERSRRRAGHRAGRAPGAGVRRDAPRRRQDLDPQGDPAQAGRADRDRVRDHQAPHDRRPVHARPRRRPPRPGRRSRALVSRALGRAAATPTAWLARRSRLPRASCSRATPTTR